MRERVKVFTYVSGTGSTVIETPLEDHINEWLESVDGSLLNVSQSESERQGAAHITACVWNNGRHSLDDETVELKPGSTIRIPAGVKHNLENTGSETITCLISFSSGARETVFLE